MENKCCGKSCAAVEIEEEGEEHSGWGILGFSFVLLMAGIVLNYLNVEWFTDNSWVMPLWYLIAYVPVAWPVWKQAYSSLLKKNFFSEFTLMTVTTIGAFCIKEYPEGVAVMLFYSIGELFQDRAVDKARDNIKDLLDVRPEKAEVLRKSYVTVSPQEVETGETIRIRAGGRVPLDGELLTDYATFNTSALTGESLPRRIHKGEKVLAGISDDKFSTFFEINQCTSYSLHGSCLTGESTCIDIDTFYFVIFFSFADRGQNVIQPVSRIVFP